MNYVTKFKVREDTHFRWDEFKVVVEFCDINVQKVALYAVEGAVEGDGGNNTGDVREATEQNPAKVEIPFDRLGCLLKSFQQNVAREVVNVITGKLNFIYIISTEKK
jgi:hypothetical protein